MRRPRGQRDPAVRTRPRGGAGARPGSLAVACTLGSVTSILAAMLVYPGGCLSRPVAPGFDPWRNYLCDLIRPVAHNGDANTAGMWLARIGAVLAAIGLLGFWVRAPLCMTGRWGTVCRGAGALAALALPAVAFTPSSGTQVAVGHTVAILVAGTPGGIAVTLACLGALSDRRRRPRFARLAVALLVAAGVTGALWVMLVATSWPETWALPTAQKVAWLALVAWLLVGSMDARRPEARFAADAAAADAARVSDVAQASDGVCYGSCFSRAESRLSAPLPCANRNRNTKQ